MRRTAAALSATLLATVLLAGPLAATGQAGPSTTVSCAGASTAPECVLLDRLAAQLAPLQPVLALAGPVLAQIAPAAQGLAVQADQPGGVPASAVSAQAEALLAQLSLIPQPVRNLLSAAQLGGLTDTLEALVAELAPAAAGQQSGATAGKPTPATTGGSRGAPSGSTTGDLPSLGGSLSGADSGATLGGASSPAIPDIPVGDSLTLAPLALPDFGFGQDFDVDASVLASPEAIEEAAAVAEQAIGASVVDVSGDGTTTGLGIVAGLTVLLLGAALAAHVREQRHVIPD